MTAATALRKARARAELTQRELARRAGTSQTTLSAYETGRKEPSVSTLARLLAAAGSRLAVERAEIPVVSVGKDELARRGRALWDVLELAEALPSEPERELRFPPLRRLVKRS